MSVPEGLKISCIFILTMIIVSLVSRAARSTELRITGIELEDSAKAILKMEQCKAVRLIAWNPRSVSAKSRDEAVSELRRLYELAGDEAVFFNRSRSWRHV